MSLEEDVQMAELYGLLCHVPRFLIRETTLFGGLEMVFFQSKVSIRWLRLCISFQEEMRWDIYPSLPRFGSLLFLARSMFFVGDFSSTVFRQKTNCNIVVLCWILLAYSAPFIPQTLKMCLICSVLAPSAWGFGSRCATGYALNILVWLLLWKTILVLSMLICLRFTRNNLLVFFGLVFVGFFYYGGIYQFSIRRKWRVEIVLTIF